MPTSFGGPETDPPQIYIKDVKSSNGTFINGERLSGEAVESEPYELKSDDIVVSIRSGEYSVVRRSGSLFFRCKGWVAPSPQCP